MTDKQHRESTTGSERATITTKRISNEHLFNNFGRITDHAAGALARSETEQAALNQAVAEGVPRYQELARAHFNQVIRPTPEEESTVVRKPMNRFEDECVERLDCACDCLLVREAVSHPNKRADMAVAAAAPVGVPPVPDGYPFPIMRQL